MVYNVLLQLNVQGWEEGWEGDLAAGVQTDQVPALPPAAPVKTETLCK